MLKLNVTSISDISKKLTSILSNLNNFDLQNIITKKKQPQLIALHIFHGPLSFAKLDL